MRIVKLKGLRQINGLHYAPDGRRLLAVGGYEVRSVDEARWVDVVGGTETLRVTLNASCYAVSSDLTRMAVGEAQPHEDDTEVPPVVWFDPCDAAWFDDSSRCHEVGEFNRNSPLVFALTFSDDGQRLAISLDFSTDGVMYSPLLATIPLRRGKPVRAPLGNPATTVAFSPDGSAIATVGVVAKSCRLEIWDAKTLVARHAFSLPTTQTTRLIAFSPDGGTLAVANAKAVLLLPPNLSAPRNTLAHPKQVNAIAFTPDGRRVLTTCTDKLVRVWDASTGQLVVSYDWNVGVTNAVAVAPDGLTAAVSGQSGRVVLFDLEG